MELGRRNYEIEWQAVLFEIIDGDDRFVCGISLAALDPNRGGTITGEEGIELFDKKSDAILAQAETLVEQAKIEGIRHVACTKNEPIFVNLEE